MVHVHLSESVVHWHAPWGGVLLLFVMHWWLEETVHHVHDWVASLLLVMCLWDWEQLLEEVSKWVDLLVLVVLLGLVLDWLLLLEEVEWVVPEVHLVGWDVVDIVFWEESLEETVDLLSVVLDGVLELVLEFNEEAIESFNEVVDSWEHEGELINSLERLEGLLDLRVELLSLDMGSLDGHVPFVVEAGQLSGEFSNINHNSVDLGHLLGIRVARVISVEDLGEVH